VTELRVLVVEHEADAPAGWLGAELQAAGCRLDVRRPYADDPLPGPGELADLHGIVVLGGSMAAWEDDRAPWLPDTRILVRSAEQAGIPVLGICLGHQLATRALGGEVGRNPAGSTVAVVPVGWAPDAAEDPLLGDLVGTAAGVHWNNDVVSVLPVGARVAASSPDGAVQAARLGRHVWGVQFHPEAGPEIVEHWVRTDGGPYVDAGFDLERYLSDVRRLEAELLDGCRRLARGFHKLVAVAR
jgi:GMP synthase (glutamine-hydrolysing)